MLTYNHDTCIKIKKSTVVYYKLHYWLSSDFLAFHSDNFFLLQDPIRDTLHLDVMFP